MQQHTHEVARGERFTFGENWSRFLTMLDDERIAEAEQSLKQMLGVTDLHNQRFLDIGSGSGLFSLAARRLGATVHSFDFDPQSVACTTALKQRFFPNDPAWTIEQASALDDEYMRSLDQFDVVYSWGVLHHTGAMWAALRNAADRVQPDGKLFIAIYNDQGLLSTYWKLVKRLYNRSPFARTVIIGVHAPYLFGLRYVVRSLIKRKPLERGMALWHDMIDWLGGYPFEVAKPEAILKFVQNKEFTLRNLTTCGGRHGCNEFVFERSAAARE